MTEYIDIIVQEFIKIQKQFYEQLDMEFGQYFKKYIDSQKLEEITYDRELIWEEFDIISEYHDQFYNQLRIGDQLEEFVMIKNSSGNIYICLNLQ